MTLKITDTAHVDATGGGHSYTLSSLVSLTGTGNPAYLVVNALDRQEYTATATGETGHFSGDGRSLGLAAIGGDGMGAGIVFTWQASTGQYVNATYGSLSQLRYTDSTSPNDVTNISFFATVNAAAAQAYAANAFDLMQADASGYLGSITFATNNDFSATPPAQATPDGIAAAADAMVGQSWNNEGCWVLASTIAAEAGAGLPVQSTALQTPGVANGEWVPIFNGPAGASGTWQSLVSTGDMVVFSTSADSGHITTCVSGSGSSAMLVDNITYIGQFGQIANSANDGFGNDVIIAPPHAAAQEFAGVAAHDVVIYALDTPGITDRVASETLHTNSSASLATLFTASDPAHKAITSYQVYEASGSGTFLVNGHAVGGGTIASPITVASLSTLSFQAGIAASSDTLEIRASNGSYWGDWQKLAIQVVTGATKTQALTAQSVQPGSLNDWSAAGAIQHATTGVSASAGITGSLAWHEVPELIGASHGSVAVFHPV